MATAQVVQAVPLLTAYEFEGDFWIETECVGYGEFRKAPKALSFEGRTYGRTGWDSDKCRAYYSTRQQVAYAV